MVTGWKIGFPQKHIMMSAYVDIQSEASAYTAHKEEEDQLQPNSVTMQTAVQEMLTFMSFISLLIALFFSWVQTLREDQD